VRWIHVFVGILWIGQTYFFTWLDGQLTQEEKAADAAPAQVWMVHSGGFYAVEKRAAPDLASRTLHWFRWEAALTWLSGALLLAIVYHAGGLMVDAEGAAIPPLRALGVSLALLVSGWLVYDGLWRSPLARSEASATVLCYLLVVAATYLLAHLLSGRAAYIHLGAMFGTLMAANVWLRILPAQRRMIAAVQKGGRPDLALAARAKQRSKHNTFLVVPVVFIMLSNHFPVATYGHVYNWIVLSALVLVGWCAAKVLRRA
jgi:uncharacterized membrane protein